MTFADAATAPPGSSTVAGDGAPITLRLDGYRQNHHHFGDEPLVFRGPSGLPAEELQPEVRPIRPY